MASRIPLGVTTDPEYGGRWTSLTGGGREWLWSRDEPRRATARPGDQFADAGGLEECVPTISGSPDHGSVWALPWSAQEAAGAATCSAEAGAAKPTWAARRDRTGPGDAVGSGLGLGLKVRTGEFALSRTICVVDGAIVADYRLAAEPGFRFIWAAHGLLDLSDEAQLQAPVGTPTRIFREDRPRLLSPWPTRAPYLEGPWPSPAGFPLNRLGPADGTAIAATISTPSLAVEDGHHRLHFHLEAEGEQPISVALWRNLGGWPANHPYRSIGIEPMLGRVFVLDEAEPGDYAVVPSSGESGWRLTIWMEGSPPDRG
ncbi:hypothetical protein [Streptomyces sp. NPDC020917]|uniref:hypothetical protein n=1 Tax=Streptomyces sp. NPDC020917 TaxID=3365102 RepID=UPI0037956D03